MLFMTVVPWPGKVHCVIPLEKPEVKVTNGFVIGNGSNDLSVQRS